MYFYGSLLSARSTQWVYKASKADPMAIFPAIWRLAPISDDLCPRPRRRLCRTPSALNHFLCPPHTEKGLPCFVCTYLHTLHCTCASLRVQWSPSVAWRRIITIVVPLRRPFDVIFRRLGLIVVVGYIPPGSVTYGSTYCTYTTLRIFTALAKKRYLETADSRLAAFLWLACSWKFLL